MTGFAFFRTIPGMVWRDTKRLAIHSDALLRLCHKGSVVVRIRLSASAALARFYSRGKWLRLRTEVDKKVIVAPIMISSYVEVGDELGRRRCQGSTARW